MIPAGPGPTFGVGYFSSAQLADGVVPGFWTTLSFWNDMGVVTLVLLGSAIFVWAIATERLVLGRQYRKVVERADHLEDANMTLMRGMMGQTATGQITNSLLDALRSDTAQPVDEVK